MVYFTKRGAFFTRRNDMKKIIMAALLSVCVMLGGCAASAPKEENNSSQSSNSQQSEQAEQEPQKTETPTKAPDEQTKAPDEQSGEDGYDWSQIPDMPTNSYLRVNGSDVTEGMFYYTTDETGRPLIMAMYSYNGGTYVIGVAIPDEAAKDGAAYNNSEVYSAGCSIVFTDYATAEYVISDDNPDFQRKEVHIGLYRYTEGQIATFYVKTDIPINGSTTTLEMAGESQFIDRSQLEGSSGGGNAGGGNGGRCWRCAGTGKCYSCNGDGICSACRGEGWFGDTMCLSCTGSGRCDPCGGDGLCPVCGGTGIY